MDEWRELIKDFLEEAYMLIEHLEEGLLNLEKDLDDQAGIDTIFRVAHTIKGGAGAVGFDDIQKLTHIMEDVLDLVRNKKYRFTHDDISLLLKVRDELELLLKAYEKGQNHPFEKTAQLISALESIKEKALNPQGTVEAVPVDESNDGFDALPIAARFQLNNDILAVLQGALESGEAIMFIEIRFNQEYEMKEVGPFEILNIINGFAEPILMNPDIDTIEAEYFPYLNVVIPTEESVEFVKNKLMMPDVVSRVDAYALDDNFYQRLEQSMYGDQESDLLSVPEPPPPIESNNVVPSEGKSVEVSKQKTVEEEKKNPTLRVESSRIDELLNILGELVIIRSGLMQFNSDMEKSMQNIRLSLRNFLSSSNELELSEDAIQNSQRNALLRESLQDVAESMDNYGEYVQQLSRISGTLQSQMMHLRMVPVQTVFSRFPRLVRDIAKQLDKKIDLIIEGGETEIDKGMIDDLYDPLMHMIRNSMDHGIELPQQRLASGKPDIGTIKLSAYQEGDSIFIEISDDGRGIDTEKIKEKAIDKGLISSEQTQTMSKREILSLIFAPGFSTAEQVSNLSGRGVGMDVVRKKIEELGGSVSISTDLGKGTTMRVQLPLTLAIIQGLLILIGGVHYVIPVAAVEETVILDVKALHKLNSYYALEFRDKLIPLIALPKVLYGIDIFRSDKYRYIGMTEDQIKQEQKTTFFYQENAAGFLEQVPEPQKIDHMSIYPNTQEYCIIIKYADRQIGIVVSDILGEQDIVIKPLDTKLISSPGLAAATIVGNGEIGFILDIPQIVLYYLKQQQQSR
ncbi:two-component system, chemotaxis family, sensor kinase CheA [Brevinema andersonii]|uniref:Chemotaxis protein CheA n=1 Tax=Brevinema andersonii TaxID=34097 RepID=A0A1I1CWJ7_BREAD|nr:ATP-binding protein [Brevinema andersonii]SFB67079.1 two-component system, chemotaxis family, sensor kinase CheA [Brevinema andersonii]